MIDRRALLMLLGVVLAACSSLYTGPLADAGRDVVDAGTPDSGAPDTGMPVMGVDCNLFCAPLSNCPMPTQNACLMGCRSRFASTGFTCATSDMALMNCLRSAYPNPLPAMSCPTLNTPGDYPYTQCGPQHREAADCH